MMTLAQVYYEEREAEERQRKFKMERGVPKTSKSSPVMLIILI
jgi:hypothetical protein